MIEIIPLKNYYEVYLYIAFFLVVANLIHALTLKLEDDKIKRRVIFQYKQDTYMSVKYQKIKTQ